MQRSRGSEMPQRQQSPRVPLRLRTTACSESNIILRPRSPLPEKKGTRAAGLETKLTRRQEEVKKLREQLANAEAGRRNAERELEETKKRIASAVEESVNSDSTDVFEVVSSTDESDNYKTIEEAEKHEGSAEIFELNAKLSEMERVIQSLAVETESLKKQVEEAKESVAAAKSKEENMCAKLVETEEKLSESRANAEQLGEELEKVHEAKADLEAEMKRLRAQTEQWRKAAEAAAAVLSSRHDGSPAIGGGGKKDGGGMKMFWKKATK